MYMTQTAFPGVRASLAPVYAELSDEQIDALVSQVYGPGVSAAAVESFWNDVGRGFQNVAKGVGHFAQQAAPVAARALPGIAQGAMTGASIGGPWGALAGAVAGGAGGILSQSRDPTLRGIGGAIGGATQKASQLTGGGALGGLANVAMGALGGRGGGSGALGNLTGSAIGGGQRGGGAGGAFGQIAGALAPQLAGALGGGGRGGAANLLTGLLSRPEVVRALSAAAMGQFGRSQVMVGSQPVGVQSILGAVGNLAGRAASEAEAATGENLPAYYYGSDGELAIDPADADQRTDALLELFATTRPPRALRAVAPRVRESVSVSEYAEPEYTDQDALNDEWLLATESALWGESDEFNA